MKNKENHYSTIVLLITASLVIYFLKRIEFILYFGLVLGLMSILSSYLAHKIHVFWMFLGKFMNRIMPTIFLTLIFYFILTPLALLSRIFSNKDPLNRLNNKNSYFLNEIQQHKESDFEKLW
jgi:hypothetical protein